MAKTRSSVSILDISIADILVAGAILGILTGWFFNG